MRDFYIQGRAGAQLVRFRIERKVAINHLALAPSRDAREGIERWRGELKHACQNAFERSLNARPAGDIQVEDSDFTSLGYRARAC